MMFARASKACTRRAARRVSRRWRRCGARYGNLTPEYFPEHLDDTKPESKDVELLRQALRGAGYFRLTRYVDKIASFFNRAEPYDDLRDDALFAYALAMPGETTRGRVKGMLRKIDSIANLSQSETELVMFALDERLRLAWTGSRVRSRASR